MRAGTECDDEPSITIEACNGINRETRELNSNSRDSGLGKLEQKGSKDPATLDESQELHRAVADLATQAQHLENIAARASMPPFWEPRLRESCHRIVPELPAVADIASHIADKAHARRQSVSIEGWREGLMQAERTHSCPQVSTHPCCLQGSLDGQPKLPGARQTGCLVTRCYTGGIEWERLYHRICSHCTRSYAASVHFDSSQLQSRSWRHDWSACNTVHEQDNGATCWRSLSRRWGCRLRSSWWEGSTKGQRKRTNWPSPVSTCKVRHAL